MMTLIELCDLMTRCAKEYRNQPGGVGESLRRNQHMHEYRSWEIVPELSDAVLTDFVNFVARDQGVDLAMYASDLSQRD